MKKILSLAAIFLCTTTLFGQTAWELYNFSTNNYSLGSARSAAMGGAFSALGVDGVSPILNPAGYGLYSSSDGSMTLSVISNTTRSTSALQSNVGADPLVLKEKDLSVPLSNFNIAINLISKDRGLLRGFTLGYTYNVLNEYSYSQKSATKNPTYLSRLYDWAGDLGSIHPDDISYSKDYDPYYSTNVGMWGAMLAYNTGMLFANEGVDGIYYNTAGYVDKDYYVTLDPFTATVYPELYIQSSGRKVDNSVTAGFNFIDKIYWGFSLGSQTISTSKSVRYSEFQKLPAPAGTLDMFDYTEYIDIWGSGFAFKTGLTIEPVKGLKVAAAIHTPISFNLDESYSQKMDVYYIDANQKSNDSTPENISSYTIKTPMQVMVGFSYVVGRFGIISFDFDRVWYNKMEYQDMGGYEAELNNSIASNYKAANNYRVGAEGRITDTFYLRAGYAHYGNGLKGVEELYNSTNSLSGGLGLRANGFYLDVAYVYSRTKSPSTLYYGSTKSRCDSYFINTHIKHSAVITAGSRF